MVGKIDCTVILGELIIRYKGRKFMLQSGKFKFLIKISNKLKDKISHYIETNEKLFSKNKKYLPF